MTQPEESTTEAEGAKPEMEKQAEASFDPRARHSGSMGGGASGPRDMPTGGRGQDETGRDINGSQGSSNVAGQQAQTPDRSQAPEDKGQEEIENYGSRREDEPDELL